MNNFFNENVLSSHVQEMLSRNNDGTDLTDLSIITETIGFFEYFRTKKNDILI